MNAFDYIDLAHNSFKWLAEISPELLDNETYRLALYNLKRGLEKYEKDIDVQAHKL